MVAERQSMFVTAYDKVALEAIKLGVRRVPSFRYKWGSRRRHRYPDWILADYDWTVQDQWDVTWRFVLGR